MPFFPALTRQPTHLPMEAAEWYGRKEIFISCNKSSDELLFSPELKDVICRDYKLLVPAYQVMKLVSLKSV